MKRSLIFNFILLGLVLAIGATGCRHKVQKGVTSIPGQKGGGVKDPGDIDKTPVDTTGGGIKVPPEVPTVTTGKTLDTDLPNADLLFGMIPDAAKFKANTAYFDYDRAVVKASERVKIEEVAVYLKGALDHKLMIDGHCDERGTEEYNRSLSEKRALALREYLVKLGIAGDRVYTRPFGEDRPALEGHDEAAWSKNRRGEFILLKPKPSAN